MVPFLAELTPAEMGAIPLLVLILILFVFAIALLIAPLMIWKHLAKLRGELREALS